MRIHAIGQENKYNNQKSRTKQPAFGRLWEEHISWGANFIKDKGKTNFKLFSFPDAKAVFVEVADKATAGLQNIRERLVQVVALAGAGLSYDKAIGIDENSKAYKMEHKGDGIYVAEGIDAKPDDKYRYIIVDGARNVNIVKDPYAKKQENIHGWSSIYEPDNYEWKNTKWLEGKDPRRIMRNPEDKTLHGLSKLRIEEINIPTVTKEGTYLAAKSAIDRIVKEGTANAIEIMPVENTYSKQWGYDGVDKFAINERMGTHAELKELIDYAHGKGLNVIMDMVPNHNGQDGDYLAQTGQYEWGDSEWGSKFNYEHENNKSVRDFMANAALWWLNEFKVDGLRLDMTQHTASDYLLKQIVDEVNHHNPGAFMIAEDGREKKLSLLRYDEAKNSHEERINDTDMFIELIQRGKESTPHAIGFDSEWDFRLMHALWDAIAHNNRTSLTALDERMIDSDSLSKVKYIMSHDEIGNHDGTRMIPKIMAQYLNYFDNMNDGNYNKGQKAAHLSQEIFVRLLTDKNATNEDLKKLQENYNMRYIFDKTTLVNGLKAALAKSRLAYGTIMTIPGPKMYFQGENNVDMSYFKFFRDFSPEFHAYPLNKGVTEKMNAEKGYDTSNDSAMKDSIMGQFKPAGEFTKVQEQMIEYNKDLAKLVDSNETIRRGTIQSVYCDHGNMIHIHSLEKDGEKFLVFKNYADNFHNGTYASPGFPREEQYIEIFNSDDVKYGGGGHLNKNRKITADNQNLKLAANTMIILKRV